ncbi:MAG: phage holin family protein [Cellulomonadaceae bacterium]|jgi:putative membrane protein|nr:phage holin family protein [Cellulomonadaceae bacterium]
MNFIVRTIVTAMALGLTSMVISGMTIVHNGTTSGAIFAALGVALILCLVQSLIRPFVKLLSFPLYILTLGLFSLVVNALMLWMTTGITDWFGDSWGLTIHGGFWTFVGAALVVSILQTVIGWFAPKRRQRLQGAHA